VIVECSSCHAKYKYDETRFDGKKSKKIKCAKCAAVFEIANPSFETVPAEPGESTAAKSGSAAQRPTANTPIHDPTVDTTKELRISRDSLAGEGGARLAELKKFSLAIISGPDAGKIFPIEKLRMVIGRAGADIVLNDTEISRKHCAIDVKDDRIILSDLGSTNGTYYEDKRISSEISLVNQSEFFVGSSNMMLIITDKD